MTAGESTASPPSPEALHGDLESLWQQLQRLRERLEGGGVEDLPARRAGPGHRVLGDEGLAGAGGRRDQHRPALVERVERGTLEGVEGERPVGFEGRPEVALAHGAAVVPVGSAAGGLVGGVSVAVVGSLVSGSTSA